jgi:hypothetical protein
MAAVEPIGWGSSMPEMKKMTLLAKKLTKPSVYLGGCEKWGRVINIGCCSLRG